MARMQDIHVGIEYHPYHSDNWPGYSDNESPLASRVAQMVRETEQSKLDEMAAELAKEIGSRLGGDSNYDDGDCIFFERRFNPNANTNYSYVALKAAGLWFVTGRNRHGYRIAWSELMTDFIVPAYVETGEVWVATEWKRL